MMLWKQDDFFISTDKSLLDHNRIFAFLKNESYWAQERSREIVEKSIENSLLCFGVYKRHQDGSMEQVGFARIVTDLATFAYLCDVFVVSKFRGLGLSKWLMSVIVNHPDLESVRRMLLVTFDAHTLYAKYGFQLLDKPNQFMQRIQNQTNIIPYFIDENKDDVC
ncbi:GNAT family N-acetyltransferase [Schinkia sp. CFF1]